jgi:hypothetical protein
MNLQNAVYNNELITTMSLVVGSRCFPIYVLTDLPHNFFAPPTSFCQPECRLDELIQEIIADRHQPVHNRKYMARRASRGLQIASSSTTQVLFCTFLSGLLQCMNVTCIF